MNEIDLSVVIPIYNAEQTIKQCVESVVREVETNNISYEILLVNDGSIDNSLEICKKLSDENSNIRILTQNNSGPSVARNNGLKNARGEFIALNDSDDKWLKGKLRYQLEFLRNNPDVSLVTAKYGALAKEKKNIEITYNKEVFRNYFSPPTALFRKEVCKFVFPEHKKYSEDMHFILDVMREYRCVYMPFLATINIFEKATFGESGLSSNLWEMEKGELSNIIFAFKIKKVNIFVFSLAYIYSLLKFIRRVFITALRKKKIGN